MEQSAYDYINSHLKIEFYSHAGVKVTELDHQLVEGKTHVSLSLLSTKSLCWAVGSLCTLVEWSLVKAQRLKGQWPNSGGCVW